MSIIDAVLDQLRRKWTADCERDEPCDSCTTEWFVYFQVKLHNRLGDSMVLDASIDATGVLVVCSFLFPFISV
jgi:hypothetical protein